MQRIKEEFVKLFKADFLIGAHAMRNWAVILFVLFIGIIMIYSGHLIDQKIYAIAKLEGEVKELRSEFVDVRSRLQKVKLESTILSSLKDTGLKQSLTPPKKIKELVKDE